MDVVVPKNNEEQIISIAEKLKEKKLMFLYEIKEYKTKKTTYKTDIEIIKGLLITNDKDLQRIPQNKEYVFVRNPTRNAVENKKVTHIFDLEDQKRSDFIHHRNSGLNQVLAKIIVDTNKTLCFSYNLLLNTPKKEVILGRMKQNMRLAKKYKIKTETYSFATTAYELRAKNERESLKKLLDKK